MNEGTLRDVAAGLLRGARSRHPLLLPAGLLLAVGTLGWLEASVRAGAFAELPEGMLLRRPVDDWVHVSHRVATLARRRPDGPSVYLLGGSSMRECIVSEDALAGRMLSRSGVRPAVHQLASSGQTFAESLAIVDNVPPPGLVVLGINYWRFITPPAENAQQAQGKRLLLSSPRLRRFLARDRLAPLIGSSTILPGVFVYAQDYYRWRRADLRAGRWSDVAYRTHLYGEQDRLTLERKRTLVAEWRRDNLAAFTRHLDHNVALMDETVALALDRGLRVAILELPQNRAALGTAMDDVLEAYAARTREVAQRRGVPYLDFIWDLDLRDEDFVDLTHLVGAGHDRWLDPFADALSAAMPRGHDS
jgi:hypothetical protein